MAVVYIVILIGVLVFVHEFGHYLAARIFHVKVEHFSIGFGPKLYSFKRWDTNWEVRALPLGGYVQMLGMEFEEVTDRTHPDYAHAYNNKPIWQKAVINLAGPLFNLLLPIPILFAVYLGTVTDDIMPRVGQVLDSSPAVGILEPGDMITSIDGKPVRYWTTVHDEIAARPNETLKVGILRDGQALEVQVTPEEATSRDVLDVNVRKIGRVGITPDLAPAVIGLTSTHGLAARHGLASFDEVTSVDGQPVRSYPDLESAIRHHSGDVMKIVALRPQKLDVAYGTVNILKRIEVEIPGEVSLEAMGIASANMFLSEVDDKSPAAKAGLQAGDRILEADGKSMSVFRSFVDRLATNWEEPHTLLVQRGDEVFTTTIQLEKVTIVGEFQEERPVIYAGFYQKSPYVVPERVKMSSGDRFAYAGRTAVNSTVTASGMLVVYLGQMVRGKVSTKSLGGPIMIGHMASKAGADGLDAFMRMLAVISINLGIINLVPIPLLDGGKLAILLVEAIKRGPISMRARQIIAYVGLAMVAMLLLLAFKNDIERLWNLFFS
ncbi:MAG: RIP metalloprotease RseP [Proteobacteria bacterium]|nr:RIP metalloprotease RseP [Pseudomonadota bacterium]